MLGTTTPRFRPPPGGAPFSPCAHAIFQMRQGSRWGRHLPSRHATGQTGRAVGEVDMRCLRIYADESGESHLEEADIPLSAKEVFPGAPAFLISPRYGATGIQFVRHP